MAQNKEQKEQEVEGGAKKKGLSAVLIMLVGAALGGAGVTVMAPQSAPQARSEPRIELFEHPDKMEFSFNPQVDRGYKSAFVSFVFVYRADRRDVEPGKEGEESEPPVLKAIKTHWNKAHSRALEILSSQTVHTLNSPEGKQHVKSLLIEELTATLFPDRLAAVHDIYWVKVFVQ